MSDGRTTAFAPPGSPCRLDELLDTLPLVVYAMRPEPPFLPLYLSQGIEALGWTPDEALAEPGLWMSRLHPDDRERVLREVEGAMRSADAMALEYRFIDRAGRVRTLHDRGRFLRDDGGRVVAWHGARIDVTAQREAEARARGQEELFRATLESLRAPALTLDRAGRVTFANPCLTELVGVARSALVGIDWFARFAPEVRDEFLAGMAAGQVSVHFEREVTAHDGRAHLIAWDNVLLRDGDGVVIGLASIGRDVGVQRRLEEDLRQAQKMEAVGRLAGGIAHDFNNILTAIGGAAEFLADTITEPHPARADVDQIREATARAGALTRQLLAFSRKQILQPRVLDLNETVTGLERLLARIIGEDVHVVTHLASGLGPVRADPGQVEQVLINLAVNARDAMPRGGLLSIETADVRLHAASPERPADLAPGDYVRLTVRDGGVGMTAEVASRAFEPFFTTKPSGKGTGLGLATVFGIVKQSGGTVTVESAPGQGSSFAIWLPRADAATSPPRRERAPETRGSETILLVEDEAAVRTLARRVLEREGYAVLEARHGRDALRLADRHAEEIALVVSDAVMPEMDGPALLRALTARGRAVPVLLMSGYTDDEVVRRGVRSMEGAGMGFLQKPFTARELAAAVRRVLDSAAVGGGVA